MTRRAKQSDELPCAFETCGQPITLDEQRSAVRISTGLLHQRCYQQFRAGIDQKIACAVAAGTHGPGLYLCEDAAHRNWVESIYDHDPYDGLSRCFACAMRKGQFFKLTDRQLTEYGDGSRANPIPSDPEFPARCRAYLERKRIARNQLAEWVRDWATVKTNGATVFGG
jgi:hypothetical protein